MPVLKHPTGSEGTSHFKLVGQLNGAGTQTASTSETPRLAFIQIQEFHHSRNDPPKAIQMELDNIQFTAVAGVEFGTDN